MPMKDRINASLPVTMARVGLAEKADDSTVLEAAVDAAARSISSYVGEYDGTDLGFRAYATDDEVDARLASVDPMAMGAGLIMQLAGFGTSNPKSQMVKTGRLAQGAEDYPRIFYSARDELNYRAWNPDTFDHPEWAITIPIEPNTTTRVLAASFVQVAAATTQTTVSVRTLIGGNSIITDTLDFANKTATFGPRVRAQNGNQTWHSLTALHVRTFGPGDVPTGSIDVRARLFREGTTGDNRIGPSWIVALRLPVG